MNRVITVVATAFAVAGCSSMSPSLDFLPKSEVSGVTVQFQSEPAGAEAKTSAGGSCKTPCALAVAPDKDFSVTFALAGYQPQTVPVQVNRPEVSTRDTDNPLETTLDPNPVYVELEPAPKAPARKPAPAKKPATAASAQAPAPKPATAAPKPATAPRPAPSAVDPWPPAPR